MCDKCTVISQQVNNREIMVKRVEEIMQDVMENNFSVKAQPVFY